MSIAAWVGGMPLERLQHDRSALVLSVLEGFSCGCIFIDGTGQVLHINDRASRHLGRDIIVREGRIRAIDSDSDIVVQRLVSAALAAAADFEVPPGVVGLPRAEASPVVVRVIAYLGPALAVFPTSRVIVTLVDPDERIEPPGDVLRVVFALTPAEARLAQRLARGELLEPIAQTLGVSPETLRVQLKSIFKKMRVKSQGQLVSFLAQLSRLR